MSDFTTPSSQHAMETAERENLNLVYPADNQLFIDIDDVDSLNTYTKNFDVLKKYYNVLSVFRQPSRSGLANKMHITITFDAPIDIIDRIALQACLGSDRMREILSLIQVNHNDKHPIIFLEKKS